MNRLLPPVSNPARISSIFRPAYAPHENLWHRQQTNQVNFSVTIHLLLLPVVEKIQHFYLQIFQELHRRHMTPMSRDATTTGHPMVDSYHCSACDYNSRGRRRSELQQQATSSNNGSVFYMAP